MQYFYIYCFMLKKNIWFFVFSIACISAASASDYSTISTSKRMIVLDSKSKKEIIAVDATINSLCTGWKLWGEKVEVSSAASAVQRYFSTAQNALFTEHLSALRKDGTYEGTLRSIKSSDELRDSFRNVHDVKCTYSIKTAKAEIFRIIQNLKLPNNQVLVQKFALAEICDEQTRCRITNRFFKADAVEALFQILDKTVVTASATDSAPKLEKSSDSVKGNFYLMKNEREFDFQINLPLEGNTIQNPLQATFSDKKEAFNDFYLGPLGDAPLFLHKEVATKNLPQQLLIKSSRQLVMSRVLRDTAGVSVVRFATPNMSMWVAPTCANGKCAFTGVSETLSWKILSTIQFAQN
jgi:hypothetical protein